MRPAACTSDPTSAPRDAAAATARGPLVRRRAVAIAWLTLAAAASSPARAEAPAAQAVRAIEVIGNQRTARDVILAAADIEAHAALDADSLDAIRQRVMNLKLFESVEVTLQGEEGSRVLRIYVKERWTLLPIPFFSTSSRGTQGGLFLLETNLFGRNKLAAIGGTYASWGGTAFAFYEDPAVAGSRAVLRAAVSYAQAIRERRSSDQVVFATDDRRFDASLLGGYKWFGSLWLSAGWFAAHTRDEVRPDFMPLAIPGGYLHGPAAAVEYRGTDFKLYYEEGASAVVRYRQARKALGSDRDVLDVTARAQYTRAWIPGQSTSLIAQGFLVRGDRVADAKLLGGSVGTRGFALQSLWVDRAATLTLEHQIPVFVRSWSIWTTNLFIDAGAAALGGDRTSFLSPGAGIRMYLPRMNFPAVGFDLAYATDLRRVLASVSVGVAR